MPNDAHKSRPALKAAFLALALAGTSFLAGPAGAGTRSQEAREHEHCKGFVEVTGHYNVIAGQHLADGRRDAVAKWRASAASKYGGSYAHFWIAADKAWGEEDAGVGNRWLPLKARPCRMRPW